MIYQVAIQYVDTVDTLPLGYATYEEALTTAKMTQSSMTPGDALSVFVIAGERLPVIA